MTTQQTLPPPDASTFPTSHPSLYVGDLDPSVSEPVLHEIFKKIGNVMSIRICRDRLSSNSLGYAYVNYTNFKDAERALDTLNYFAINGKQIRLMWSHRDPRLRKSGSGNIFIKNLPKSIDNKGLHDICSEFGNILSCKVALDENLQSRGYGFVHYDSEDAAETAIQSLNHKPIRDSIIYVGPFMKKSERPANDATYTNLYVKNFPVTWDEQTLMATFSPFGNVTSLAVRTTPKQQRFAFVNFEIPEQAQAAIEALHGKTFKDDHIVMDEEIEQSTTENNELKEGQDEPFYVQPHQEKHRRQAQLKAQHATNTSVNGTPKSRPSGTNLYIKNFDSMINDEQLRNMFLPYGPITSAIVRRDEKGENLGFGFVNYVSQEDAVRAVTEMNGYTIHGKPLYVSTHEPKEARKKRLGNAINISQMRTTQNNQNMFTFNGGNQIHPPYAPPYGPNHSHVAYRPISSFSPNIHMRPTPNTGTFGQQVTMRPPMNINMFPTHPITSGMMGQTPPPHQNPGIVPTPQPAGHQTSPMPNNGVMMTGTPTPPNNNTSTQQPLPNQLSNLNIQQPGTQTTNSSNTANSSAGNNTTNATIAQPLHPTTSPSLIMSPVTSGGRNTSVMTNTRGGPNYPSPVKTKASMPPNPNLSAGYKFTPQVRNQLEQQTPNYPYSVIDNPNQMISGTGTMMPPSQHNPNIDSNPNLPTISLQQLSAMTSSSQKQYLGEQLFYRISKIHPDLAGKITGMMLEMENEELLALLNVDNQLHVKIQEAIRVLHSHNPAGPN